MTRQARIGWRVRSITPTADILHRVVRTTDDCRQVGVATDANLFGRRRQEWTVMRIVRIMTDRAFLADVIHITRQLAFRAIARTVARRAQSRSILNRRLTISRVPVK